MHLNSEISQIVQSTLNFIIQFVVVDSYTFIRSWYHVPQPDELSKQTPVSNFMEIRPRERERRTVRQTWRL